MSNINELRELLQKIFLKNLFIQKTDNLITLKGGVAINFERSERYTKDIDLQVNSVMSNQRLKKIINKTIKESRLENYINDLKVTVPKETETTVRWKINGTMKNNEPFNMTVEVSKRENADLEIDATEYYLNNFSVVIYKYSINELILSKMNCLVGRTEPRDLYDLYYLFKEKSFNEIKLVEKISKFNISKDQYLKEVEDKINRIDFDLFCKNLKPYLKENKQKYYNESKWDDLRLDIIEKIILLKNKNDMGGKKETKVKI